MSEVGVISDSNLLFFERTAGGASVWRWCHVMLARMLRSAFCGAVIFAALVSSVAAASTQRDGSHDFDFLMGTWNAHYKVLRHPLSGSQAWYEFDGRQVVRPVWGGKGNIEEGYLARPTGLSETVTLRIYSPKTREWSLYWATALNGLNPSPQVGHFNDDGIGDFFDKDTFGGKPVIVRYRWSKQNPREPHFEQAFSVDNGKSWETNWICDYVAKIG